ncbi:MAG: acyltransferase family protein [Proteobacteria bacterium]|nr:acyltransferase family protein [Pseudomonadota bacterium]
MEQVTEGGGVYRSDRRVDLDWLRIAAFVLLIVFHVAMFYAPWAWEVKSPRILPATLLLIKWSAPWRLMLLFLISGAALGFMSAHRSAGTVLRQRTVYLLPPLFVAVVLVIPPQAYLRAVELFDYSRGYLAFWREYLAFDHRLCDGHDCSVLPDMQHMWFVAYLWLYTVVLVALLTIAPRLLPWLKARVAPLLKGWRVIALPAVYLSLARIALEHFFPETHRLYDDWYLHAIFLSALLFGFLFFTDHGFMRECERLRWLGLLLGVVAYTARTSYTSHYQHLPIPIGLKVAMAFSYGCEQWAWIVAAAGFAYRHLLTAEGPWRRTLTEAIFPCYIIHQTAIVVFAHELARLRWPLPIEMPMVVLLTALACVAGYASIRRVPWLRPAFGMKPLPPRMTVPPIATKASSSPAE